MSVELTTEERKELKAQLEVLNESRTGDIFKDGEIVDQILEIELKLGIIEKNNDSPQECFGCGS